MNWDQSDRPPCGFQLHYHIFGSGEEYTLNAGTIFRGFTTGDLKGPYVSQFLLKGSNDIGGVDENEGFIKYGNLSIDQRQYTLMPALDYMTDYNEWVSIHDGRNIQTRIDPSCNNVYDTKNKRFIRNMRDLASRVHFDEQIQHYINASLILLHMDAPTCVDLQATYSQYNPYRTIYNRRQNGFITFGPSQLLGLVTEAANAALKAAWFHKWYVHRRLRPEEFGGLIHKELRNTSNSKYPIHKDIIGSTVMLKIFKKNTDLNFRRLGITNSGSYLLPQVYPEGSPVHPSYPSGHAVVAGACVTILKAFFDENYIIPNPVQSNNDGTELIPATNYDGRPLAEPLTVGNELNKLASNISIGRNMAGIHYRSDYRESMLLGEKIAISILRDQAITFKEKFRLRFTGFKGNYVVIENI